MQSKEYPEAVKNIIMMIVEMYGKVSVYND